ncbi:MAG: LacI family DNA-binding transcriptional regulator [Hydrogenophaga sp.]|nr:LacI family DNA-binding transcriptional regulator [Hydrogenophaga sp.]
MSESLKPEPPVPGPTTPKRHSRVQMADLARMAGVSISTVSRALSGSPLIQPATRERIALLARSLNYQVNAGAASLRRRDLSAVGVLLLDNAERPMQAASDPFIMTLVSSLADALAERGLDMLLARYRPERQAQLPVLVDSGRVAGLILIGQCHWHEALNELARRDVPMVVWGAEVPGGHYAVVGTDNEAGGHEAACHLIAQGCRRLAFLGDRAHPEVEQRFRGYQRALQQAGLEASSPWVEAVGFDVPEVAAIVDRWLDADARPDGVFACSDLMALSLIRALGERGLGVPGDLQVVGYDDIPIAAHTQPSLSTVRQPMDVAGRALVDLLAQRLDGLHPASVKLPAELCVRESSVRR